MRILAVGWENLASLEIGPPPDEPGGERLLRLDRPPLSQVGVFAITGPTGSGKTTILDAICLALFNATPRLGRSGGVRVGRSAEEAELAAFDTRNLLRRGAGEGCAICVFEGRDGVAYRATWRARRARRAPGGRLQKVDMDLREEAGGQPIGRTNSEVQAAIRDRLGLDFDQFRRSVLLAQGEFAAFLAADGDERADLLEKVTGTTLYARIGRETFDRAGREEQALALLRRDREALGLLDPAVRRQLESDTEWLRFRAEHAEFALGQALEVLRRDAEITRLATRLAEAEAQLAAARAAVEGGAREVARRDRLRRLREHSPALAAFDGAARVAEEAALATAAARVARGRAEASREAAMADWLRAATAAVVAAREAHEAAQARVASLVQERAGVQAELDGAPADVELAAGWGGTERALVAAVAAAARLERADARSEALLGAVEVAQEALVTSDAAVATAAEAADDAARGEASAREGLSEEEATTLQLGLAAAMERQSRLRRVMDLQLQATSVAEGAQRWEAEARAAATASKDHTAQAAASRARQAESVEQLPGIAAALRHAQATADLGQHRDVLVDGEPCPLCGAEEHPWAEQRPEVASILQALESQLAQVRTAAAREGEAAAASDTQATLATEAHDAAVAHAAAARSSLEEIGQRWVALADGMELPAPDAPDIESRLAAATDEVGTALAHAQAAVRDRRAREDRLTALAAQTRAARGALDAARKARDAAQARLLAAQAEQQVAAQEQADDRAMLAAAEAGLGPAEAEQLAKGPAGLLEQLRERVRGVTARRERLAQLGPVIEQADAVVVGAGTRRAVAEAREVSVREGVGPEAEALAAAGSGPVRPEPEAAASAEQAMERERAAASQIERCVSVQEEREAGRTAARATLDDVLAELALDEGAMRAQLAELEGLESLEAAIAGRDAALATATGVCADRRSHLEEQRARSGPKLLVDEAREVLWTVAGFGGPGDDESVAAARVRAEREVRASHEALGRLVEQLDRDDEARGRGADLEAGIAQQAHATALWTSMRELIGDSQGKRFRSFAQSLTLDLLLAEANRHLDELEPRYRMERAPPADGRALLALQVVDRDMGDEVRPTSSLSGGEGFLVSLALALALSSLSADGSTVGSLFIDEGFGTLDEKTLETALAVLEALQAGGRQVGIISHVQKLAENIGAQVIVQPEAPGLSRVTVAGPGYS